MKFNKIVIIFIVTALILSSFTYAQDDVESTSCKDVPIWDLWGKLTCTITSKFEEITQKFTSFMSDAISKILNPNVQLKGIPKIYDAFQWLAMTGIAILFMDMAIMLMKAGFEPASKEIAARQFRNILTLIIMVIAAPIFIDWMLDLVVLISTFIMSVALSGGNLAEKLIGSLGALLLLTAVIFFISWPILISIF